MSDLTSYRIGVAPRLDRRSAAEVRAARRPVRRAVTLVQGAALVAHVGLTNIETLTAMEVQAAKRQGALMDARAGAVVDTYTGVVTTVLARLPLEMER